MSKFEDAIKAIPVKYEVDNNNVAVITYTDFDGVIEKEILLKHGITLDQFKAIQNDLIEFKEELDLSAIKVGIYNKQSKVDHFYWTTDSKDGLFDITQIETVDNLGCNVHKERGDYNSHVQYIDKRQNLIIEFFEKVNN